MCSLIPSFPLPSAIDAFWSAPAQLHHRLALRVGIDWTASFLACVAAAARAARYELTGLQRAEAAGVPLARTARSHLPRALDHVHRPQPGGQSDGHTASGLLRN